MDNWSTPEPFSGNELEVPLSIWTDDPPGYVRTALLDIRRTRANSTGLPLFTTFNGLTRIRIGNMTFPWDGVTSMGGPDLISEVVTLNASISSGSGVTGQSAKFNLGMEKI